MKRNIVHPLRFAALALSADLLDAGKVGILAGSAASAALGYGLLRAGAAVPAAD